MSVVDVYLASASPRRRELLQQIGVRFAVHPSNVPEARMPDESPVNMATRLAQLKAESVWLSLPLDQRKPVIGSDTIVVVDNRILGKPLNREHGIDMLRQLANRQHQVITAVAIYADRCSVAVNENLVRFRDISADEAMVYWDSGEPVDKAGGYAIQGLAAVFVKELIGSYSGVMGLPLFETAQLLKEFDVPIWSWNKE